MARKTRPWTLAAFGLLLVLVSACTAAPFGEKESSKQEDGVNELRTAARKSLRMGFAYEAVWEDSNFGPEGGTLRSEGSLDVPEVEGSYTPMLDATGGSVVRIKGRELFVGSSRDGWLTSRAPPDTTWLELMPLGGAPVLRLQHLADGGYVRVDTAAPDRKGEDCGRYQTIGAEATLSPGADVRELLYDPTVLIPVTSFTACTAEGELRWLQYPPSDPSGALTFEFRTLENPLRVARPSENVTEVETPVGNGTQEDGGAQEDDALDIPTEVQER